MGESMYYSKRNAPCMRASEIIGRVTQGCHGQRVEIARGKMRRPCARNLAPTEAL